jgi:hypothetical protein
MYHRGDARSVSIQNLLINVPPGHAKSLIVCVLWLAWQWIPARLSALL